jgi:hypothetical protein
VGSATTGGGVTEDQKTARLVVLVLGFLALGGLVAIVTLALFEKPIPEVLGLQTAAAFGAVASMLNKVTGHGVPGPRPVEVQQPAGQPVPVAETPTAKHR